VSEREQQRTKRGKGEERERERERERGREREEGKRKLKSFHIHNIFSSCMISFGKFSIHLSRLFISHKEKCHERNVFSLKDCESLKKVKVSPFYNLICMKMFQIYFIIS
jgi:hypothetical protein